MEKVIEEIFRSIKEKVSSPFFRYFCVSRVLRNYKFLYFIFFQDSEIFFKVNQISKFSYLSENIFYLEPVLFFLVYPLVSTLFFIFIFPFINFYILKFFVRRHDKEGKMTQRYKKESRKRDLEITNIELENVQKEVAIKQIKEEEHNISLDFKRKWDNEFESFKTTKAYNNFDWIIETINLRDGRLDKSNSQEYSYCIVNDIIEKPKGQASYRFTDKGRYFAKLYFDIKGDSKYNLSDYQADLLKRIYNKDTKDILEKSDVSEGKQDKIMLENLKDLKNEGYIGYSSHGTGLYIINITINGKKYIEKRL